MQRNEPKVAAHRPVYKRIAIGSEPAAKPNGAVNEAAPYVTPAEAERVWRHVTQSASGTVTPPAEPAATPEPEPVDPYGMYGGYGGDIFG